jgi:hypothetical protein
MTLIIVPTGERTDPARPLTQTNQNLLFALSYSQHIPMPHRLIETKQNKQLLYLNNEIFFSRDR